MGVGDLLVSYALIAGGFWVLGLTTYGWLHRSWTLVPSDTVVLVGVTVVLVLSAFVMLVLGLNWHGSATKSFALPGRERR